MAQMPHFDDLEIRSASARAADIAIALPQQIARAQALSGYAGTLDRVEPANVTNAEDLAKLPVLRKSEIGKQQALSAPFGGFTTRPAHAFTHIFQSPGPIYEPSSHRLWVLPYYQPGPGKQSCKLSLPAILAPLLMLAPPIT